MRPVGIKEGADWRLGDDQFLCAFQLPSDRCDALARRNPMPRERRITFDEVDHVYTVDGIRVPISATGFLHCFSEEFVASDAIAAMQAGRHWESRRDEFLRDDGDLMSPDEIACKWVKNGAVQRARGTLLHYHAEQLLNDRVIEEPHSPEFKQIIEIVDAIKSRWEVYRTEFSMFHCGLRLAGQADQLCRDADGRLVIIDWKRSREIKYDAFRPMKPPLEHLPDCNYYLCPGPP